MRKQGKFLAAALLVTAIAAPPAFAAGDAGDGGWRFDFAPFYGWMVTIDGTTGVGPSDQKIEADFGDIWDSLEFMATGHLEARNGRWGGIVDASYLNLGQGEAFPIGIKVDVDVKNTMVELDGFYSIPRGAHVLDILAGFRYTDQRTEISISPPGVKGSVDASWWDPLVGARWIWGFAPGWQLTARGDVGGFGVGSDFTWNASALLIWQPWKHVSIGAGYRALDQDYEDGDGFDRYKWDATVHGPLFGINFRW